MGNCTSAAPPRELEEVAEEKAKPTSDHPKCARCGATSPTHRSPLASLSFRHQEASWAEQTTDSGKKLLHCQKCAAAVKRREVAKTKRERDKWRRVKERLYPKPSKESSLKKIQSGHPWQGTKSFANLGSRPSFLQRLKFLDKKLDRQGTGVVGKQQHSAAAAAADDAPLERQDTGFPDAMAGSAAADDAPLQRQPTGFAGAMAGSAAVDDAALQRQPTGFAGAMAGSAAVDDAPLQRQPTGYVGLLAGGAAAEDDALLERQATGFVGLLADAWASGASPLAGMQLRSVQEQPAGQHGEGEEEAAAGPVRSGSHTGGGESPHTASVCESPAQLPSRTSGSSSVGQRGDN